MILALSAALLAPTSIPAHASAPALEGKESYVAIWVIDPQPIDSGTRMLHPHDVIASARLLPTRVVAAQADVISADGTLLVPAGTLMMVLTSVTRVACTFSFPPLGSTTKTFVCLTDANGDGKFESSFQLGIGKIGVPQSYGMIPRKQTPVQPVAYEQRSIGDEDVYPRLHIKYSHRDQITGIAYVGVCTGNSPRKSEPCFDGYTGVKDQKVPMTFEILGCKIEVLSKQDAVIAVRVLSPMVARPFTAQEYTRFY